MFKKNIKNIYESNTCKGYYVKITNIDNNDFVHYVRCNIKGDIIGLGITNSSYQASEFFKNYHPLTFSSKPI